MRLVQEDVDPDDFEARVAEVIAAGGIIRENEYGTPVSVHTCATCGEEFTVCPPTTIERFGPDCLDPTCASYDPARDAEVFFAPDDPGLIEP